MLLRGPYVFFSAYEDTEKREKKMLADLHKLLDFIYSSVPCEAF